MPGRSAVRFRRRVVLEMLPDENDLLQRLAAAHGSIRGTILSALRLLETDESDKLRARITELEAKLAKTKEQAATAKSRLKNDETSTAKVQSDLTSARTALRDAQTRERQTKAALTKQQARAADLQAEATLLGDLQIHYLYCADCGTFIGEDEWAEQPASKGVALYHKTHKYRAEGSLLGGPATVMAWRAKPHTKAGRGVDLPVFVDS